MVLEQTIEDYRDRGWKKKYEQKRKKQIQWDIIAIFVWDITRIIVLHVVFSVAICN